MGIVIVLEKNEEDSGFVSGRGNEEGIDFSESVIVERIEFNDELDVEVKERRVFKMFFGCLWFEIG